MNSFCFFSSADLFFEEARLEEDPEAEAVLEADFLPADGRLFVRFEVLRPVLLFFLVFSSAIFLP